MLAISMNLKVFSETPKAEAIQSGEGKNMVPRPHNYQQLVAYRRQYTAYSMEHCRTAVVNGPWRLES